jgi:dihydropteroate synthase
MINLGKNNLIKGERTYIMGVVNITPNSFSDGGDFLNKDQAILHALKLLKEGADIIDIGGESTGPGAMLVSEQEELDRVIPVIEKIASFGIISVDTMRAKVALEALKAGARIINDQSAGLDIKMPDIMSKAMAVIIMHDGKATGVDAGERVFYQDLIGEIANFFKERIFKLKSFGVDENKIIIDPGIGFGKGEADSLNIINNMSKLGPGLNLIGLSRKSLVGRISGINNPKNRDYASLGAEACAIFSGADIIRTHRVLETVQMVKVLDRCLKAKYENLHQAR